MATIIAGGIVIIGNPIPNESLNENGIFLALDSDVIIKCGIMCLLIYLPPGNGLGFHSGYLRIGFKSRGSIKEPRFYHNNIKSISSVENIQSPDQAIALKSHTAGRPFISFTMFL